MTQPEINLISESGNLVRTGYRVSFWVDFRTEITVSVQSHPRDRAISKATLTVTRLVRENVSINLKEVEEYTYEDDDY